jgi:intergrase/recombinase
MLMNAANKGIKNVANNIDTDLIVPTVERLYFHLMLNDSDPTIKGDLQVKARGASGLMMKELLNQRRIEFMREVPVLMQMGVVKPEGVAALMREIVKGLEMPQDRIVPSDDEIRQMQAARAALEMAAAQAGVDPATGQPASKKKPEDPKTQDQELRSLSTGPKE